jgi:MFS family permease
MIIGALSLGVLETVAGLMPTVWAVGLLLVPTGVAMMAFATTANTTVQLSVSPAMRGRVMGLYMLVFLGGNPIGGPVSGWLAEHFTARAPLVAGGILCVIAALAGAAVLARRQGRPLAFRNKVRLA